MDDIAELKFNIFATITGNMKREVETEDEKEAAKDPKQEEETEVSNGTSGMV